jgi:hypothetical protein
MSLQHFEVALHGERAHPTISMFERDYPLAQEHLEGMNRVLSANGRGRIALDGSSEQGVGLLTLSNERTKQETVVKWFILHDAICWSDGRLSYRYPRVPGPSYQEHGERDLFIRAFNKFVADFFNG